MKLIVSILTVVFAVSAMAAQYNSDKAPKLAGQCLKKTSQAARKAAITPGGQRYTFGVDEIMASEYEENVYSFLYAEDECFYQIDVRIKPTNLNRPKNQILDCQVLEAADDGQPNCG